MSETTCSVELTLSNAENGASLGKTDPNHLTTNSGTRLKSTHYSKRVSRLASTNHKYGFVTQWDEAQKSALPFTKAANFDEITVFFQCKKKMSTKVSLFQLLSFSTTSERWWMVLGLFFAILSGLGIPAWLVILANALDTFSSLARLIESVGGDDLYDFLRDQLNDMCIAFVVVGAVTLVSGTMYVSIWTYTGEKQALRIQEAFVKSAMNQDAAWFDHNDRDELPTKMGTALLHINRAIGRQMVETFALSVSSAGALAVALVLNSALSLIMLAILPFVLILIAIFNYFIRKRKKESSQELAYAGSIATEVIAGIKTVAAFCAQTRFGQSYDRHVDNAQNLSIRSQFLSSLLAGLTGLIFYCTYTMAFYIGTKQVITGAEMTVIIRCFISGDPNCRITGASVMCCIYGVILAITFVGLFMPGLNAINLGRQAAIEIFDTIERTPPIDPSSEEGIIPENYSGRIEFQNVFFFYASNPNKPIFYNFNLTIEAGTSMALVGPSGCGKSTIAKFLLRFYDTNDGGVYIDDIDIKSINLAWWRSRVAYVEQEPRLFPGTIRQNIAWGLPPGTKVSDEQVVEAATLACAHDFIQELPNGYDTFYSGTSLQLSGGQMQRIAIARAVIRCPAVLVLDEATSALDSKSERLVQRALANIRKMRKMTTVSVAHRLSTIVDSDQIAVIAEGKLAELGNHKELMDKEGIYHMLCESQGITKDSSVSNEEDDGDDVVTGKNADISTKQVVKQSLLGQDDLSEEDMIEVKLAPMCQIMAYLGTDWGYLIIGSIGSVLVGALSPAESILTAQIVATFYTEEPEDMLEVNLPWILRFFYFALGSAVGNIMIGIGLSRSGSNLAGKMRRAGFGAILKRSMGWFDESDNTTGELTTLLAVDSEAVSALVGIQLGYRIRVMSSLITGIAIAWRYSRKIGAVALACVPAIMLGGVIQAICARKKFIAQTESLSPPTILEQGLRGITSVQAYGLEKKVGHEYSIALIPESAGKVKQGAVAGIVFGFSQCMIFMSFALVFYVGSELLVEVEIGFVEFFTAVLAVMFGAIGASQVTADFRDRQNAQAAAARIFSVFDGPEDGSHQQSTAKGSATSLQGGICFDQVDFHYPTRPEYPIFYNNGQRDGLNLSLLPKESLGLVGRSGSGKSTVLQLLLRFYDISSGSIEMDENIDLHDLNVSLLRNQIGYVSQQPTLFNGTVRENILLGKPDATDEEVISAAVASHAHEFVSKLSDGYDTNIGSGGGQLSGGQKQRIAIARAILRQPKILVLDEATSALDNESEKIVQAALDDLQEKQPRTTLVVAHRLQTVKNCDQIVFLGDGGVQERGTHDDLVGQEGQYSKLWRMQGAEDSEEGRLNLML